MTECELKLLKSFGYGSFINHIGVFVANKKGNASFTLKNCKSDLDIKCKVLEWLSRDAYKAMPYRQDKKNNEYNQFMLDGINKFLETNFGNEDIRTIYCELGNGINHALTLKFIESGYNMAVLKGE